MNATDFWDYFNMDITGEASTMASIPSPEQGFVLGMYCALLVVGAVGNAAVFASLLRSRRRKSRVNLLMTHLAGADLIVTTVVIPLEGFVLGMYCALLVVGAVGNAAVFASLLRSRRRTSRVNLLMTHLAGAKLIVTPPLL